MFSKLFLLLCHGKRLKDNSLFTPFRKKFYRNKSKLGGAYTYKKHGLTSGAAKKFTSYLIFNLRSDFGEKNKEFISM